MKNLILSLVFIISSFTVFASDNEPKSTNNKTSTYEIVNDKYTLQVKQETNKDYFMIIVLSDSKTEVENISESVKEKYPTLDKSIVRKHDNGEWLGVYKIKK